MSAMSQAQAVMLLTVSLRKADKASVKPLSIKEWARLADWLKGRELPPSSLLEGDIGKLLSDWTDKTITLARLEGLLGRGVALASAVEKWERAGLWSVTNSDPEYPQRLKQRLESQSPPVLFGAGNQSLLNKMNKKGGIAVVGSRNATEDALGSTKQLGAAAAAQELSVVSGGARGIDQSALLGALEAEGTAVGVLADGLLRSATSAMYRKHIKARNLVLVSPFNPEAGFNVGHSMARNRYVYCLADAAVVISSDLEKGGTWYGAVEALKAKWGVPLWVKDSRAAGSGNGELMNRGAKRLPDDLSDLRALLDSSPVDVDATPSPDSKKLENSVRYRSWEGDERQKSFRFE